MAETQKTAPEAESVPVRNRDIPKLCAVPAIMQEIIGLEERRAWQRSRAENVTQHLTGMPGGGEPHGLDTVFAAISALEEEHEKKCARYIREVQEAERILDAIPSRTMRAFVTMRYMLGSTNRQIMRELNLSRWGFESARRSVEEAPDMAHVNWQERFFLAGEREILPKIQKTC